MKKSADGYIVADDDVNDATLRNGESVETGTTMVNDLR
jgi:hypothetical protein